MRTTQSKELLDPDPISIAALLVGAAGLLLSLEAKLEAKRSQQTNVSTRALDDEISIRCKLIQAEYRKLKKFWKWLVVNGQSEMDVQAQTKSGFGSMRFMLTPEQLMEFQTHFSAALTSIDIVNRQITELLMCNYNWPSDAQASVKAKLDELKVLCNEFMDSSHHAKKKLRRIKKIISHCNDVVELIGKP